MTIISANLKRLRLAKKLTQEQAAAALGVSPQTVSRWECGNSLPDVAMLPDIAALYCVTIDDLYRETAVAYDNYAQRLGSVFESTLQPEDFLRAELEYRKLLKSGASTPKDLRLYGILWQYMMQCSIRKTAAIFDQVLQKGPEADPETYWATQRQRICYLHEIGRNHESIEAFLPPVQAGRADPNEWICLIQSYSLAEEYDTALDWALKAEKRFPENTSLHIYLGDIYHDLQRYDEAFSHWQRARELEPDWLDAAYAMGFCYEELGQYEQACRIWDDIAENLARRGFEAELDYPRQLSRNCRAKLNY